MKIETRPLRIIYILAVIAVTPVFVYSQENNQSFEKTINQELNNARVGKLIKSNDNNINFSTINSKAALNSLKKYKGDSSPNVRFLVQTLQYKIAMNDNNTSIRQEVVNSLVNDYSDTDPLISQQAAARLLSFHASDFSSQAKNNIIKLKQNPEQNKELILIIGVAQILQQVPQLKLISIGLNSNKTGWDTSPQWYATLALARMGSNKETEEIVSQVQSESNIVLRVTKLLGDVAYIRQPIGIKLLQKYLELEERLPSVRINDPGIKYNQYALNFLTQSIENFPVKDKGVGYSEQEIELALSWMKNQSNFVIIK